MSVSSTSAWFGDLKDGTHKGDASDPRVSIIEVVPDEIRYWYPTRSKVMRAVEIGVNALTGEVASPGELRTLTPQEVCTVVVFHLIPRENAHLTRHNLDPWTVLKLSTNVLFTCVFVRNPSVFQ